MPRWLSDAWAYFLSLLQAIDVRSLLSFLGEKLLEGLLQAVTVVVIGWLVLYRQWRQITQGRSDQVVFSANLLTPLGKPQGSLAEGECYVLQIRTVLPPKTVDGLLDNVALRRLMRHLAEQATLVDPILATHETAGFEILNDIVNCVAGSLASSPYPRDQWLMAVTCEDRKVVRKCCIRVLLVRRSEIERLASWEWCRGHILVEEWYHYWRIVTSTRSRSASKRNKLARKQVAPQTSRKTFFLWSIDKLIIPEFGYCRSALTSTSRSSRRPPRLTGPVICRTSPSWA